MMWFAFILSLLIGLGSLTWSYTQAGLDHLAVVLVSFGLLWLYASWKGWEWFSPLGLFLALGLAAYGLWIDLSIGWMLAGAIGGLMAWDLADFMRRHHSVSRSDDLHGLQRRHLARLTIVAALGLTLASTALAVRLEFTFEWIVVLTLVAILGISQMIAWLRRGGE
jgi:hypothetical protein